jgi:hypothetical protein
VRGCTNCKKGLYKEMSIHDDWDGTRTCDKCGHRINSKELDKMSEKIEWKTWESQGELKETIRDVIDTGAGGRYIVESIQEGLFRESIWTDDAIRVAIDELEKDGLIVNVEEECTHYLVTEWAHDGIMTLTKIDNFQKALEKLREMGIYHRDMVRYGIITEEQKPK